MSLKIHKIEKWLKLDNVNFSFKCPWQIGITIRTVKIFGSTFGSVVSIP